MTKYDQQIHLEKWVYARAGYNAITDLTIEEAHAMVAMARNTDDRTLAFGIILRAAQDTGNAAFEALAGALNDRITDAEGSRL